jgi:UDP-N-acetylglucosamine--N-acetylmuramyl-(pentapeptide) pyrophosphoryl-undecaprenol N-acetylglucosamine transferase
LLPKSVRGAAVVTGNPVRPQVLTGQADRAVKALGWEGYDPALPLVYVTGGAQGSVQINTTVRGILPWLLEHANVVHQCGPANVEGLRREAQDLPQTVAGRYYVTGFLGGELADVLALAEVVISRSGAGTIAELTALGKAAVLIPLASAAGNEQNHNARHLQEAGAAVALVDEVSSERLREAVEPLLADPSRRAAMADRARTFGRPDAAEHLADAVLEAARR